VTGPSPEITPAPDTAPQGRSALRPEDVPGDLIALVVPILRRPCRCGGTGNPTGDVVVCSTCMDSGSIGPIYSRREAEEFARELLAATLPAHEAQVRADERAKAAAEYRAAADAAAAGDATPLAQALWTAHGDYGSPFVAADPRSVAALALRHLADRLTEETP